LNNVKKMFNDFNIITLKRGYERGILLKVKKPEGWILTSLDNIAPTQYYWARGQRK
jgi:hypothetical protein